MNRTLLWRIVANGATAANVASGLWAIIYVFWGNKPFALALIFTGIGWDGLDGYASRRSGKKEKLYGRVADSVADSVTFCIAPAVAVAFGDYPSATWSPYQGWLVAAAVLVATLGIARLTYFTVKVHSLPHFLGASTPQNALALTFLLLLFDVPGYIGVLPLALLMGTFLLVPLMVIPINYPKIRDRKAGRPFLLPLMFTGVAALSIPNFHPPTSSVPYFTAYVSTLAGLAILLSFYVAGPLLLARNKEREDEEETKT